MANDSRSGTVFLTQVVALLGGVAVFGLPLILVGAVSFARIFQSSPYNLDATTSWEAVGMIPPPDLVVHALDVTIEPYAAKAVVVLAIRAIMVVVAFILYLAGMGRMNKSYVAYPVLFSVLSAVVAFILSIIALDPPAFIVHALGIGPYIKVVQRLPSLAFFLYGGFMAGGAIFLVRLVLGVLRKGAPLLRSFFRGKFFRNAFWALACAYGAFLGHAHI
jgi:hypothetical protein